MDTYEYIQARLSELDADPLMVAEISEAVAVLLSDCDLSKDELELVRRYRQATEDGRRAMIAAYMPPSRSGERFKLV